MKNKDEIRDELEQLSPLLAKRKGADEGFKVPADYFSSLPGELLKKVQPAAPRPAAATQTGWLDGVAAFFQQFFRPKYALAFASVAVLAVAGIYFFGNQNEATTIADVETEAIENYLAENIDGISTDLLEDQLAESSADQLPGLELDAMEEYLENDMDDLNMDDFF